MASDFSSTTSILCGTIFGTISAGYVSAHALPRNISSLNGRNFQNADKIGIILLYGGAFLPQQDTNMNIGQ